MGLLEQTISSKALGNSKSLGGAWGRAGSAVLGPPGPMHRGVLAGFCGWVCSGL